MAETESNSPTETAATLTVSNWYEVSFSIEDKEAALVKQSYALQERYAKNAAYTIARKLDSAIAALFSGFSQSVGASTTAMVDSDVRLAIATLEGANVPVYGGETNFILHPTVFWNQVQGIDRFALAVNSPVNDPAAKRPVATMYGIPVVLSTSVPYVSSTTGRVNVLAHKDSIHFATASLGLGSKGGMVGSAGIRVQSNYIPQYLGTLTTVDILYGVVENRDKAAIRMLTKA